MFISEADEWANTIFGHAQLGDKRRIPHIVKLTSNMAQQAGGSLTKVNVDPSSIEGAYRFIRNDAKSTKGRTLYAHSILILGASSEDILGLGEQYYWYRQDKLAGKNHEHQTCSRTEKESFKWQLNSERLAARLGNVNNVIDVCDREADIYEYLDYHTQAGNRFVVRANDERKLAEPEEYLSEHIASLASCGQYQINIQQKGGRKARQATLNLHFSRITLKRPQRAICQIRLCR